jgi:hypothetical protein
MRSALESRTVISLPFTGGYARPAEAMGLPMDFWKVDAFAVPMRFAVQQLCFPRRCNFASPLLHAASRFKFLSSPSRYIYGRSLCSSNAVDSLVVAVE